MLRTLIADDEPIARGRLRSLCKSLAEVCVVGEAADGREALLRIRELAPDIVLLDIAMPELNGLEVASALSTISPAPHVIFCTASDAHAVSAFDLSATDYLLKPVSFARLTSAFEKVAKLQRSATVHDPVWIDHVWAPRRGGMVRVAVADLTRLDAERDYVRLTTSDSTYLVHATFSGLSARLNPQHFIQVRRSAIVRAKNICGLRHMGSGKWAARLTDGSEIKVGLKYLKSVKNHTGLAKFTNKLL